MLPQECIETLEQLEKWRKKLPAGAGAWGLGALMDYFGQRLKIEHVFTRGERPDRAYWNCKICYVNLCNFCAQINHPGRGPEYEWYGYAEVPSVVGFLEKMRNASR